MSSINKMSFLWLLLTVLVFTALVKLGFWQNSRALEKELRISRIEQLKAQSPLSLAEVNSLAMSENINDMPVIITGNFDKQAVILLDNQVNNGGLGYRVYQVFTTKEHTVLVNLGWIKGIQNRQELPTIEALEGKYNIRGNVRLIDVGIQLKEQVFTDAKWPLRVQQVELDKLSLLIKKRLLPYVIYLDKNEKIGFIKNWQPIVMPPEKHRAYAFQWFTLAATWLILMVWAKFGLRKAN